MMTELLPEQGPYRWAYEAETLELLEWPTLLAELQKRCISPLGQALWQEEAFLHPEAVSVHALEVSVLQSYLVSFGWPLTGTAPAKSLSNLLKQLERQGTLSLNQLFDLLQACQWGQALLGPIKKQWASKQWKTTLATEPSLAEQAFTWLEALNLPKGVLHLLRSCIDEDSGAMLDSASPELFQARQSQRDRREQVDQAASQLLQSPSLRPHLRDQVLSERNGRCVLIVQAGSKNQVPGVLHGQSGTGQTVFIEPQALVPLNNRLQASYQEVEAAMQAVLKAVSENLHEQAAELNAYFSGLAQLEKRLAAAQLSRELDAQWVKLNPAKAEHGPATRLQLKQLRHPLLVLQQAKTPEAKPVVANDVTLAPKQKTLLVTGPNTGGKSVLLKALGLCVLMSWAGLPLPVAEGSSLPLYEGLLADLGDAQDLGQNLSTFSGHLRRLASFLQPEVPISKSLVLIDEIAAGTDPIEGSALARAYLRHLTQLGATTVVTTHLGALKLEAREQAGFVNASVAFDAESLQPTYRLLLGTPGGSHALTIARRYGMAPAVLTEAETLLGQTQRQEADVIVELEQHRLQAQQAKDEAEALRREWDSKTQKLREEWVALQDNKKRILSEYRAGLKARLRELEQQSRRLKKQLNQVEQSDPQEQAARLRYERSRLTHVQQQIDEAFEVQAEQLAAESEALVPKAEAHTFKVGEQVRCSALNGLATIEQLSGRKATVRAGELTAVVALKDLNPVVDEQAIKALKAAEKRQLKAKLRQQAQSQAVQPEAAEASRSAKLECDIRGQRVQEGLEELEQFLDTALLAGFATVGVIHGVGTGALKQAVREQLKQHSAVLRFYPAEARFGGDGKTIIELK